MAPKHPKRMGPPEENYMVLTDEGPEYFGDAEEAREEAERAIEDYVLEGNVAAAKRVVYAKVVACCAYVGSQPDDVSEDELDEDFDPDEVDVNDYELLDVDDDDSPVRAVH